MKGYSAALSLVGAAFALTGALAYLVSSDPGWVPLANLGFGLLLVIGSAVANPQLFRQYAQWLNAFWGAIMVLAIVAMVNFLANRYPQRLDVTAGKLHSLSDLTVQSLEGLEQDVQAVAFVENGKNEDLESLLEQYAAQSPRFEYEMVDLDRDPDRAIAEYGVRSYNTLVLRSGERQQKVTDLTEKEITSALLKLLRGRQERVYLTVGHGEKGLGEGDEELGRLKDRLAEIDYSVADSLLLARAGEVPQDCRVLVIAGPRSPFLEPEVAAIRRYLERGGAVLALLDPPYQVGLSDVLREWGVEVGDDFVIDTSGIGSLFGLDFTIPVAASYSPDHAITRKHRGGVMTVYELARSVHFAQEEAPAGAAGADLVLTTDQSWAESDLSVLSQQGGQATVRLDPGVDRQGPISLAAAVQGTGGGRLVVFGDSDMASNRYFDVQGNGDLALNAVSWLAEDESLISIRPKQAGFSPIALTDRQSEWIFWICVIVYPAAIALIGILVVSHKGRWSFRDLAAAGLGIAAALGVVVLVNFVADRYHHRFDLTTEGLFTLAPETVGVLDDLEHSNRYATVKTFMSPEEGLRFQEMLDEYRYRSGRFSYEVVDPQKRALEVKQYNIRKRGTSVVEVSGDGKVQTERLEDQTEEALSNALQRALRAEDRVVAFTTGHGEGSLTQVDGEGYSILNGRLREMNLQVQDGAVLSPEAPVEAGLLVVLGPTQPFSVADVAALRAHLERGGDALLLLDPGPPTGLEDLLGEYSVKVGQDFIVDLSGIGQLLGADVAVPVVIRYGQHPIVDKIPPGTMSFFPYARSIMMADHRRRSPEIAALGFTDRKSWGETDLRPLDGGGGQVAFDPETDRAGPLSVAVAVSVAPESAAVPGDRARLVVFGDADFARNQYFGQQANGEMLMSSMRWLTEGENRLSIAERRPRFNPINLVGTDGAAILWLAVFVLPFAVALSGFVIMLRRGYETYAAGFVSWLLYTFGATAAYLLVLGGIGASEGSWLRAEGYLGLALAMVAAATGLHRRAPWAWYGAMALAVLNVGLAFAVVPQEVLQLVYAGLFVADACILIWIRRDFTPAADGG
ncbi:MAG: DUF4350 domain-containing protein [Gemmatimonadota bacterium]